MSMYAVFGMTRHRAMEIAKMDVTRHSEKAGEQMPESEWLAQVKVRADEIMASDQVVQLSGAFDAPQFAREFRDLAARYESKNLHIMARTNDGHTKTGRLKSRWDRAT